MKTKSLKIVSSLALLSLLTSCGDDGMSSSNSPDSSEPQKEEVAIPNDGSNITGTYKAQFETLNGQVNGTIPGSATLQRKDQRLFAYIRLFAGGPKVWHKQAIYSGDRCPTMADDTNGDGFLDIAEAEQVLGKVIVPLDADIGSQASGKNFYPVADLSGSYFYERITSFERFFRDLKSEDKDPNDNVRKLAQEEGFQIIGRPVLIQGVAETIVFPETVAGSGRYRPFQTLPIVCGIFQEISAMPGVPNSGEIPGPVAEVEEGQDRPAPNGPETIPTTGGPGNEHHTGSNGTNTNETPTEEGPGDESSPRIPRFPRPETPRPETPQPETRNPEVPRTQDPIEVPRTQEPRTEEDPGTTGEPTESSGR